MIGFQSTLPVRGATAYIPGVGGIVQFQSTLPVRGATGANLAGLQKFTISIHAPREGSDDRGRVVERTEEISIHAPREGSDRATVGFPPHRCPISIHAPREGSDLAAAAEPVM